MPKTVFLWDIDGTLLLTGGSGKASFERVFHQRIKSRAAWTNFSTT